MKKLLFQLDTDPIPSSFDTVVAYDSGVDHVIPLGNITPQNVDSVVNGTIFTRPPKEKQNTALFIGGSDMQKGEILYASIQKTFFQDFRVSVLLDSNGGNTTATAAVLRVMEKKSLDSAKAVILAGTGPVGQRAAVLLAKEGVDVSLSSRSLERSEQATQKLKAQFGVSITPVMADSSGARAELIKDCQIVIAAGAAGIELLTEDDWKQSAVEMLVDCNATPPLGIQGIRSGDRNVDKHGKFVCGALGLGNLKLALQKECISTLFTGIEHLLDIQEIFALAQEMSNV
ncbi:MAG: NAD(P)-dependent methylenetetrahydromethanopterin dehydrogenase [Candidatus Eutrophobiaceae bacterium]